MAKRAIVALLVVLSACSVFAEVIAGNGMLRTEERQLPVFSTIRFSGSGNLAIHRGPQRFSVTLDSNLLPFLETRVSGGVLEIGFRSGTSVTRMTKLDIETSLPALAGVEVSGSTRVTIDAFEGKSFASIASGASVLHAELHYQSASFLLSGSGSLELAGTADRASFGIEGSGSIRAGRFDVRELDLRVAGSGTAELRASQSLAVVLRGSGSLSYWGNPRLNQQVLGSGTIRRLGD